MENIIQITVEDFDLLLNALIVGEVLAVLTGLLIYEGLYLAVRWLFRSNDQQQAQTSPAGISEHDHVKGSVSPDER